MTQPNQKNTPWTVGMIAAVRELHLRGFSTAKMVDELKARGFPPVTRNAIIGVMHRRYLNRPASKVEALALAETPAVEAQRVPTIEEIRREAERPRDKPPFACATATCRNTRQPGREHCASCITARIPA